MRIILDTNIFISAAVIGRVCEEVIKLCRVRKVSVFVSKDIINEIKDKLVTKFSWKENQIEIFLDNILEFCNIAEVNKKIAFVKDDPDDDKALECAVSAKCDYIVTGDKHLLKLKSYQNIKILGPADFLLILSRYL
ncbi:MAG: putative toxin-antitoxin system toxin component, PIN family [Actinobacteria bacterium]|nr:putative toxin-antitoxin system toxin component, PIN family [Actinomycetota bacterium]